MFFFNPSCRHSDILCAAESCFVCCATSLGLVHTQKYGLRRWSEEDYFPWQPWIYSSGWTEQVQFLDYFSFILILSLYKCKWIHLSRGVQKKLGNNDKWKTFAFILMISNSQWEKRRWVVLWRHNQPWWTAIPRSSLHSEQILEDASQNVQNWGDRTWEIYAHRCCHQMTSRS